MTQPTHHISMWAGRAKRNVVNSTYTVSLYSEEHEVNGDTFIHLSLKDVLLNLIHHMSKHSIEQYMSFAEYTKNHLKSEITQMTASFIDYPYKVKHQLQKRLDELGYTYLLIDTQTEFGPAARPGIMVVFPYARPLSDTKLYTRVTSLLFAEIGIGEHQEGKVASTYLFAPYTVNPYVELFDEGRTMLDPFDYRDSNVGVWVDARDKEVVTTDEAAEQFFAENDEELFFFPKP
ncbi:hypothetical protein [Sphingobium limneticum]|uniref:Uncharacterized protein n=1 Tax=Sphingobium limneticum TaxID=1007511 RepID=A0A5J5HSK2_9SPHN|nr:hypothetical protein [Sphingobium limneticum]KAA9010936.1 hypothetical protein F4U96_24050 [Sphingobium limneticum]KAA9023023.1 hypothetical protein F4U95_23975 [Sphingobium limneticum]